MLLIDELKRRNVFKVAAAYIIVGWLIMQAGEVMGPALHLPGWVNSLLAFFLILGFPLAMFFAWAFEMTPEGLKREHEVDRSHSINHHTGKKLNNLIFTVMALAIGYFAFDKFVFDPDRDAAENDKSIAVLPFDNHSNREEDQFFTDGIHDDLLTTIAKIGSMKVISRTSVMEYKDTIKKIPQIAQELGVAYILEGGIQRSGNQVRINVQLIDAATDQHLWAEIYTRELTAENLFAVQSEITEKIADALQAELSTDEQRRIGARPTDNLQAYDAYLVGRAFVNARTPGWQDKAIAAFEKAIRLDENYAPPYAGLAVALAVNNDDWVAVRESAIRAAETAIELDPELAEGHAALGLTLLDHAVRLGDTRRRMERAGRSLRRAVELDPSLSIAYSWLSYTLQKQGRFEEAFAVQDQGLLVDPLNPVLSVNRADHLRRLGKRDRAEQLLFRLAYLPDPPLIVYYALERLYRETGEIDKSLHWAKQGVRASVKSGSPVFSAFLGGRYERLGLTEDADYWVADAMAHESRPARRFWDKSWVFQMRGDLAGIRAEIDKLRTALGSDIDGLQGLHAEVYATFNIYVENFDVGIDVLENEFDFESLSKVNDLKTLAELESLHLLAYAYQQVGRGDEANVLLNRLHEQLNAYVVERKWVFGPIHHLFAQNFGLRGDFDAAADALEAAIKVGWLRYIWVMNDPTWAQTIADPRIARMLAEVKVELERQRAVVEQADAEHDFRAEIAAMRGALGD